MKQIDKHTHATGIDTAELPWQTEVLPPEWEGPYTHKDPSPTWTPTMSTRRL
jgi:L-fuconolactonase